MKKIIASILIIFCLSFSFGCASDKEIRQSINQYLTIEMSGIVKDARLEKCKCKKVKEKSTKEKTVFIYSFFVGNKQQSLWKIMPFRVYYEVQYDHKTKQIKVLDHTVVPCF